MSEHTPGPWRYANEESGYPLPGFVVYGPAETYLIDDGSYLTNEADARLIAAAPDLLAALERLADGIDLYVADKLTIEALADTAYEPARAAIARAKGAA